MSVENKKKTWPGFAPGEAILQVGAQTAGASSALALEDSDQTANFDLPSFGLDGINILFDNHPKEGALSSRG